VLERASRPTTRRSSIVTWQVRGYLKKAKKPLPQHPLWECGRRRNDDQMSVTYFVVIPFESQ
jgi:hypothetical protein